MNGATRGPRRDSVGEWLRGYVSALPLSPPHGFFAPSELGGSRGSGRHAKALHKDRPWAIPASVPLLVLVRLLSSERGRGRKPPLTNPMGSLTVGGAGLGLLSLSLSQWAPGVNLVVLPPVIASRFSGPVPWRKYWEDPPTRLEGPSPSPTWWPSTGTLPGITCPWSWAQ